jgi:hypothetical protein
MKPSDKILKIRAEFPDIKSLADIPYLSLERLARFRQKLADIENTEKEK